MGELEEIVPPPEGEEGQNAESEDGGPGPTLSVTSFVFCIYFPCLSFCLTFLLAALGRRGGEIPTL